MRYLVFICILLFHTYISAQPVKRVSRVALPKGSIWVERGLHGAMGIGQVRQWQGDEFLYVNEVGGFSYSPSYSGELTVVLQGGLYNQLKFLSVTDSILERRIFVSERYGMNVKFYFVSSNKERVFYLSPVFILDNASNSSLETSTEVDALTDSTDTGKLIRPGLEIDIIERDFVEAKGQLLGGEIGFGERYRNSWGFTASCGAYLNPFKVKYGSVLSKGAHSIPIWESSATVGVAFDLIEFWMGVPESIKALFFTGDAQLTYDDTVLGFSYFWGLSMAF